MTNKETKINIYPNEINEKTKNRIFEKFSIRDITFLCIMGALSLITSLIMPVALFIPMYGASQLITALQLAIFPAIGLFKVKKVGSFSITMAVVLLYTLVKTPLTFVFNMIVVMFLESLAVIFFKGFKNQKSIYFVTTLYSALTLPFTWLVQNLIMNEPGHWDQYLINEPWIAAIVAFAILVVSFIGCWLGMLISKELIKAGLFEKWDNKSKKKTKGEWVDKEDNTIKVEDASQNQN
ncbi:MAG: hypothetical protein ACRC4M_04855 [Mycoplasma sp.]